MCVRKICQINTCNNLILCRVQIRYLHLRGFGFVLPIEELWQGSALNGMNTGGEAIMTLCRLTAEINLNDSLLLSCAENTLVFISNQN